VVIAFAGRRIDAADAPARRFPIECREAVAARLEALFRNSAATTLVSSAACGADLVAIEVARAIGMAFVIVLPFDEASFAATSVTDRPGSWLAPYEQARREARQRGDLIVLNGDPSADSAYALANDRIIREAERRAADGRSDLLAVIAHEGASRGAADLTEAFARAARESGIRVEHVSTLC
jgi:hypothetical protein